MSTSLRSQARGLLATAVLIFAATLFAPAFFPNRMGWAVVHFGPIILVLIICSRMLYVVNSALERSEAE